MYPVSDDFKKFIYESGREILVKAEIDLANGTHLSLNNHDVMEGGLEVEDSTSDSGKFQVGAAIINQLTLKLNNFEGKFNGYNFDGAVIKPFVGLVVKKDWHGDTVEYVPMGVYTVDDPSAAGSIITITALDNMAKLDIPYSKSSLSYPATLKRIAEDACAVAGVVLVGEDFLNSSYVVAKRPTDKDMTCREILSYIAQLAGCFARCNRNGEVEVRWYEGSTSLYNVGTGSTSCTVAIFDTIITGVEITGNDDAKTVYKSGTEDYAISIKDNPLAQDGLQSITDSLASKFVGFSFRAYTVSSLSNPAIEAGDLVNLTDNKGTTYKTFVSHLSYAIGGSEQYSADAESPIEKSSQRNSASSQTLQKAHEEAAKQISAYDVAVKQLSQLMINAMGFYETVEKQPDGAEIDYMHDKPELADSTTVWKRTIDGIAVSTDGGHTFTAGITADGNAIVKVLTTIGINADWINAGHISANLITAGKLQSKNGSVYFDLDNNELAVEKLSSSKYPDTNLIIGRSIVGSNKYPAIGLLSGGDTTPFVVIRRMAEDGSTEIISSGQLQLYSPDKIFIGSANGIGVTSDLSMDGKDVYSVGTLHADKVDCNSVSPSNGYSGGTVLSGANGSNVGLTFENGILTSVYQPS